MIPYDDWQFWIVTSVVLLTVVVLVKQFLPHSRSKSSCCSAKQKKTSLTISAKLKNRNDD